MLAPLHRADGRLDGSRANAVAPDIVPVHNVTNDQSVKHTLRRECLLGKVVRAIPRQLHNSALHGRIRGTVRLRKER